MRTAYFTKVTKTAKFCRDATKMTKTAKFCKDRRALLASLRAPTRTANFTKITNCHILQRCNKNYKNYENCKSLQRQNRALLDLLRALMTTANFTKTVKFCRDATRLTKRSQGSRSHTAQGPVVHVLHCRSGNYSN